MKFTFSWLKEHISIDKNSEEVSKKLTDLGLEVEKFTKSENTNNKFLVVEVVSISKHPNADRLKVCKVSTADSSFELVCGAKNVKLGMKTVFAPIGSYIPGIRLKLEKKKIRGVTGEGMLCSEKELGISDNQEGIIELSKDYKIGSEYVLKSTHEEDFFEIALTPNRGDCSSVKGIARELAASGLGKLKYKKIEFDEGIYESKIKWKIEEKKEACPYIIGRYFKNVKNVESPDWLKKRLLSIGIKPISSLVDITNFLTFDIGRPLHVFDAHKLSGDLTVRYAYDNEKLLALDKKTYYLGKKDLIIADEDKVVSFAGIIGGETSSVDKNTKEVFLEVAYFDPNTIAYSGRKHEILTDARYRFERGIDPNMMEEGMNKAVQLIKTICGGEVSKLVKCGTIPRNEKTLVYRPASFEKIVGFPLSNKIQKDILRNLGFLIKEDNKIEWSVSSPSWRHDIEIENDIIEELARVYGYENIPTIKLSEENLLPKKIFNDLENKNFILRENLAHKGLNEIITLAFNNSKKSSFFIEDEKKVIIDNPISQDLDSLRPSLVPNLLDAAAKNIAKGQESISFFELGYTYKGNEYRDQKINLAGIRIGYSNSRNWHEKQRKFDVFDIKSDFFSCLKRLNIPNKIKINRNAPSYYHPGKSAEVKLGSNLLGYFGEIHPNVSNLFNLKEKALIFELFTDELPTINNQISNTANKDFSPLMTLKRDFSFLMPKDISASKLIDIIQKSEKEYISAVRIFDVYKGKEILDNYISIALEVEINQGNKTLTIEEIDSISNNIINSAKKELNVKLR